MGRPTLSETHRCASGDRVSAGTADLVNFLQLQLLIFKVLGEFSVVSCVFLWFSMVFCGFLWFSMVFCGFLLWFSMFFFLVFVRFLGSVEEHHLQQVLANLCDFVSQGLGRYVQYAQARPT